MLSMIAQARLWFHVIFFQYWPNTFTNVFVKFCGATKNYVWFSPQIRQPWLLIKTYSLHHLDPLSLAWEKPSWWCQYPSSTDVTDMVAWSLLLVCFHEGGGGNDSSPAKVNYLMGLWQTRQTRRTRVIKGNCLPVSGESWVRWWVMSRRRWGWRKERGVGVKGPYLE